MIHTLYIDNKQVEVIYKGAGKHTVVIQTGMACSLYDWIEIVDKISLNSKVLIYHRPGYGKSDIGSEARTTKQTVKELNLILKELEIDEPIILVAHSYGGLCAQHFTKTFPDKVAGLVLIDSTSVNLHKLDELDLPVTDKENSDAAWLQKCKIYSSQNSIELKKELNPKLSLEQRKYPKDIQRRILEFEINPSLYKAIYSEIEHWHHDASEIKKAGDFPNIPLYLLARDPHYSTKLQLDYEIPYEEVKQLEDTWHQLIKEQANLSEKSEFHIVDKASHSIQLDRPDFVIKTIEKMIRNIL